MRRRLIAWIGLFTALSVGVSSAQLPECKELPPKEWEATLQTTVGWGFISFFYFQQSKCNWNGADALNGTDSIVWDVTEYAGLPVTIEISNPNPPGKTDMQGLFLTADCRQTGTFGNEIGSDILTTVIPEEAKWVGLWSYMGTGMHVKMTSAGNVCLVEEEPKKEEPKKKKKKKKKKNH